MTGCSGCYDYGTTEGRVNTIAVDPTTTTPGSIVAYLGSVGGGVWKTTNCCSAATTRSVPTDDPLIGSIAIDSVTIDPNDHNTIYAGTGDLNYGSFSMGSQGILKSTDAGAHWTVLGSDVFGPAYVQPAGQYPQYDAVGKVRVDPNNSQNVVAGTKKGVFVSYDGGTNWTGPCAPSTFTTQRQDITGLELSDMGGGVTRILAAVGVRGFASTVQYDLGQNGANGIYSATMPASGCPSFASIASNANGFVFGTAVTGSPYGTGANINAGSGAPYVSTSTTSTVGDQLGRIDIGVAPSNPNVIYAQAQGIAPQNNSGGSAGCANGNGCQLGVFVTTNGGTSWSFMAGSAGGSLKACATTGAGSSTTAAGDYPQNWYDQGVAVDPNNPDRVFFDTFDIWLASRTGTTWYDTTCGYNGNSVANHVVHVDQHALAFLPGSSSTLLTGSDGGVYSTLNANAAVLNTARPTFTNMDSGLNTIEFYSGDISGNFANSASPSAVGGAQDNGPSSVLFSGSPTGPAQWQMGLGGDGFTSRIDPVGSGATSGSNPRYWEGNNSGGLSRCVTNCTAPGASWSSRQGGWTSDTQSFVLPYDLFHGGIPGGDDCGPAGATTGCGHLIAGTTRVFETVTGATTTNTWVVTNNPTTQNMTKQSLGNRSFINMVKYSPKWSSVAAVGTNDANYWIGFNLGTGTAGQANWVNVTGGNSVLPNRPVLGVALDPSSPNIATEVGYAAVGGFNANTTTQPGHLFQVSCSATCTSFSWLDKSGNLPDIPVDSVIVNPNFPQQVFAGTDFGLYYTNDITANTPIWQKFQAGVPSVMIWDMQIDRGATTLSLWTRSRGAYVWPLPSAPVNRLSQTITFAPLADRTYGDPDFNVSATASSGLTVSFIASGTCTVTGTLVHITGAGSCTITAQQAGNSDYSPAPDVPRTFTVAKAAQTITFGALSNRTYGDPDFNVSATASSGLTVTFGATGNCTVTGTLVHITGAGSCTVTASQPGDSNYLAAADVPQAFTIAKAAQTITFAPLADKTYGDPDFNVSATASSGLTVTFAASGNCTVTGTLVHITGAGSCTITASQPGDSNYLAAADVPQTFAISKHAQTITFGALPDRAYNSGDFNVSATASSGLTVSFTAAGTCTVSGTTVHMVGYGSCTVTAHQPGDSNWSAAPDVPQTFAITDSVPPVTTATLTPGLHNGWYASPTLTLTGADGTGSGIAHIDYALDGGSWTTYAGPLSGFTTGNHFVQYRSTDVAGRQETAKLIAFKVDAVKPSVTITAPADGASYPLDKVVTAKFKCTDNESGMDTCVGSTANGANLDTSTIGPHAFTVTGTDLAGNVTTLTTHYTVVYTFNGFFSPIGNESDQSLNLVHAGDLIKVGFGLDGDRGPNPGAFTWAPTACPSWAPHTVPAGGQGTTAGLSYGAASGHYTYGWQTQAAWAGTCQQLKLTLNDGTTHTAVFMFFA